MNTKTVYWKQLDKYYKADIPDYFDNYIAYKSREMSDAEANTPDKHPAIEITRNEYLVATAPDFQPFDNQILVVPDAIATKTKGGIHLPDELIGENQKTHWGVVVRLGTNPEDKVMEAQPGDYVAYSRFAGTEIELEIGGEKYRLIRSTDIHGRVPGKSWGRKNSIGADIIFPSGKAHALIIRQPYAGEIIIPKQEETLIQSIQDGFDEVVAIIDGKRVKLQRFYGVAPTDVPTTMTKGVPSSHLECHWSSTEPAAPDLMDYRKPDYPSAPPTPGDMGQ